MKFRMHLSNNGSKWYLFAWAWLCAGFWLSTEVAIAQDLKVDAPVKVDLEMQKQRKFEVLEPDGTRAVNAQYFTAIKYAEFTIGDEFIPIVPPSLAGQPPLPIEKAVDGYIEVHFFDETDFLVVWSKQGYLALRKPELSRLQSIQLRAWARLNLKLLDEDVPAEGVAVDLRSSQTDQRRTFGLNHVWKVKTDKDGFVRIPHFPPGLSVITTHVNMVQRGLTGWEVYRRQKEFKSEPGKELNLRLGGAGRSIQGEIELPKDVVGFDFSTLHGTIELLLEHEKIEFSIAQDGSFESPRVPYGECKITIETYPFLRNQTAYPTLNGSLAFKCEEGDQATQSVGSIPVTVVAKRTIKEAPLPAKAPTKGEIKKSENRIAMVASRKTDTARIYVFFDDQGNEIQTALPQNSEAPLGKEAHHVALDPQRDRIYLIVSAKDGIRKALVTLDFSGNVVRESELSQKPQFRIAVNEDNGELWLLQIDSVRKSSVQVLGSSGEFRREFKSDAYNLCYSKIDHAMWCVGTSSVKKLDAQTGMELASWSVPFKAGTFSLPTSDSRGGILFAENFHAGAPQSSNRLFRVDSNAKNASCVDLGNLHITSMASAGKEVWVAGIVPADSHSSNLEGQTASWCFDHDFNLLEDRYLGVEAVASALEPNSIWFIKEEAIHKASIEPDGTAQNTVSKPVVDTKFLFSN